MKILITGFDPFGGEDVNPAYESLKLLPKTIAGAKITTLEIPTVFGKCEHVIEAAMVKYRPDAVLSVGQAGGRFDMTVERVAINLADGRIADNEGNQPVDKIICPGGEAAYFSTLPVKAMVERIRSRGIPASVSYTAGSYVCNYVMYCVLRLAATKYRGTRAGFIHVPYMPSQVVGKSQNTPSMSIETIAAGLQAAIEAIVENETDISAIEGAIC